MNNKVEKRQHYRRYEDRRVAMMLAIYKTLFDEAPGPPREEKLLGAILENFKVDRVLLIDLADGVRVRALRGKDPGKPLSIGGAGFGELLALHRINPGALSFERVRKPELFTSDSWNSLWTEGMGTSAQALMSILITPAGAPRQLLWLQQLSSSREWGSRDRDLIEEVTGVLAQAADKALSPK